MTRVAVCGRVFARTVETLGLEDVVERPDLVLVDLADGDALRSAAALDARVPRVAVGTAEHELLLRALGIASVGLAVSATDPAALGPLVAAAVPSRPRRATRTVVVTATAGGTGRTLLTVNLSLRLATRASVLVLDATGSGAAGWWLRLAPGPWSDLEGLVDELTAEHVAVVAAEQGRLRLIGGVSAMPSVPLVLAACRASAAIADVVLVDAPPLRDERTRALADMADRVLVLSRGDPASVGALDGALDDDRAWLIGSRDARGTHGDRVPLRSLPDDPAAVRSALGGPGAIGGALGRAYDDLADLLAIDAERL